MKRRHGVYVWDEKNALGQVQGLGTSQLGLGTRNNLVRFRDSELGQVDPHARNKCSKESTNNKDVMIKQNIRFKVQTTKVTMSQKANIENM